MKFTGWRFSYVNVSRGNGNRGVTGINDSFYFQFIFNVQYVSCNDL